MKRFGRMIAAGAVTLVAFAAPFAAVPATAATTASDWWYDGFGVPEVHAEGWTGAGVKVAVIDSQINPDVPTLSGADVVVDQSSLCGADDAEPVVSSEPTSGAVHGTDMTALLVGNGTGPGAVRGIVPDATVLFYSIGATCGGVPNMEGLPDGIDLSPVVLGIRRAVEDGAQVISISRGLGQLETDDAEEVARALAQGVVIVASTPNDNTDQTELPWGLNGVVAVSAFDQNGDLQVDSGYPVVRVGTTVTAPGADFPSVDWSGTDFKITGSSNATPLVAGIVAANMQKYPDATGNQLIQSLIHNTGREDHELQRDTENGYGYGAASLRHTLSVDPAQYDDVNPLVDKPSQTPTADQIASAEAEIALPAPSASASDDPTGSGTDDDSMSVLVTVALIAGGVLILMIVVTIIIVATTRRKNRTAERETP